jgi:hypothetical protein
MSIFKDREKFKWDRTDSCKGDNRVDHEPCNSIKACSHLRKEQIFNPKILSLTISNNEPL